MNDFLNRLAEEAEVGNIEELSRLSKSLNLLVFNNSLFEQLTETAYFPSLNPEFSDSFDQNKTKEELKKETLERVINDPALYVLASCDWEAIKEITDYEFISLFEAALLIGYRVERDPKLIVFSSPELFLDAIINKQIDPREPITRIPYSKLHESPKFVDGEVFFIKGTPDLSWKLSLKEVAEFAILKGYPERFFIDLLNETEGQPINTETNNQKNQDDPTPKEKEPLNPNKSGLFRISRSKFNI